MAAVFHKIGTGFCGTVWTSSDDSLKNYAFKREDGGPGRSLLNDYDMHNQVLKCLNRPKSLDLQVQIQVPQCHRFIGKRDEWWKGNLTRFPANYSPCNILQSQRIPSVPKPIREILIDEYCPSSLIPEIKASDANRDCLIRPYLGRRRVMKTRNLSRFRAFSLRNFPLHIDQMEELGIPPSDIKFYAETMASTLAMMHWLGQIDGNDIEFVLAAPNPDRENHTGQAAVTSNILGDHSMWILDFDCCKRMSMDIHGVDQAVTAFLRNDPYYPRPDSSKEIWEVFRDNYLKVSEHILRQLRLRSGNQIEILPRTFIERIEAAGKQ
ncbi:Zinc finger domain containing protein [Elaphomyces granulatus]